MDRFMLRDQRGRFKDFEDYFDLVYESNSLNPNNQPSTSLQEYDEDTVQSLPRNSFLNIDFSSSPRDESSLYSQATSSNYLSSVSSLISLNSTTDLPVTSETELIGFMYIIAKVFQMCNLSEIAKRKLYELINIAGCNNFSLVKYFQFKRIVDSWLNLTVYCLDYCLNHNVYIEPGNSNCCPAKSIGSLALFSLEDSLQDLVERNLHVLQSQSRASDNGFTGSKIYEEIWYDFDDDNSDIIKLTLLVNTDDAQLMKSCRVCTTPVSFTCAELPRYLRYKRKNVYNLGVYHGPKGYSCQELLTKSLIEPLQFMGIILPENHDDGPLYSSQPITLSTKRGQVKVSVRIGAIILDSVAKPKCMNIKSFMGYYGCPYCVIKGEIIHVNNSRYFTYQYNVDEYFPKKTETFYIDSARIAEEKLSSHCGVFGKSVLSRVVNLPSQIPIDYMHAVLEGVFKHLLTLKPFKNTKVISELDKTVTEIKLPHNISRKFRKLSEIKYWKASECRTFISNLVFLFKDRIDDTSFMLILAFGTAIRALCLPSSCEEEIEEAKSLIDSFLSSFQEIYGPENMRFNLHLLTHLVDQYKNMGTLTDVSSFIFENNIYSLKRSLHGTRGQMPQMVKNYVFEKSINSQQEYLSNWIDKLDPHNRLKIQLQTPNVDHVKIIGEIDSKFVFSQKTNRLLRNRNIEHRDVIVFHQLLRNHEVYHSINYKKKKNSASYLITYQEANKIGVGTIFAFFAVKARDNCQKFDSILALISPWQVYHGKSISNLKITNRNLRRLQNFALFKKFYLKCRKLSKDESLIDINTIQNKVTMVPDKLSLEYSYATSLDLPFEHD